MKNSLPLFMVVLSLSATAQQNLNIPNLEPIGVQFEEVEYKKKKGLRVIELPNTKGEAIAIVKGSDFKNGTIEVELAGDRRPESDTTNRVFVGIAFRV